MFYHLRNLFWRFLSGGFWLGEFLSGGFLSGGLCPGGFCLGGFCPVTNSHIQLQAIGPAHFTDIDIFQYKIPCKLKAIAQIDLLLF